MNIEEGGRGEGVVAIRQGGQDGRGERLKGTFKRKIRIRKSFIGREKIRDTKKNLMEKVLAKGKETEEKEE